MCSCASYRFLWSPSMLTLIARYRATTSWVCYSVSKLELIYNPNWIFRHMMFWACIMVFAGHFSTQLVYIVLDPYFDLQNFLFLLNFRIFYNINLCRPKYFQDMRNWRRPWKTTLSKPLQMILAACCNRFWIVSLKSSNSFISHLNEIRHAWILGRNACI